jgi:predicted MFS family arabinose efflux permease
MRGGRMTGGGAETLLTVSKTPARAFVIPVLGVTQIVAWGSSYYLLAVLAKPIADDTGWSLAWVVGGLSLGLVVAGLVSPRVGHSIQRHGGRPVLATSALLFACGLVGLALAPSLLIYLASWIVLGAGMGAGLYDAAFSTLGRLYGQRARTAIATLTLFGGLASTLCWPLSALLVSRFGWRVACLSYAGVHLSIVLPLYVFLLPHEPKQHPVIANVNPAANNKPFGNPAAPGSTPLFVLLALAITLSAMISTVVSVHLLTILQLREIALAAAVAFGAIVGPTQVVARAIEMSISRYHHPLWTMLAATLLVTFGVATLWAGIPVVSAALIFYGAGIGIESIARATVPLAIFGHTRYAAIMGRLAMPSLIAQAAAPSLGATLMERFGVGVTLGALFTASVVNVVVVIALIGLVFGQKIKSPPAAAPSPSAY